MDTDAQTAIRRVMFDYAWAMDTKDWPLLGACFAEACEFAYGGGDPSLPHPHPRETGGELAFSRRDDFVAYIARTHDGVLSHHMMGATAIDFDAPDVARSRTYGRLLLASPDVDEHRFESAGVYSDLLRREEGRWRIHARRYTRMWAAGTADALTHDRPEGDL
jgi:hypothetical protein